MAQRRASHGPHDFGLARLSDGVKSLTNLLASSSKVLAGVSEAEVCPQIVCAGAHSCPKAALD